MSRLLIDVEIEIDLGHMRPDERDAQERLVADFLTELQAAQDVVLSNLANAEHTERPGRRGWSIEGFLVKRLIGIPLVVERPRSVKKVARAHMRGKTNR